MVHFMVIGSPFYNSPLTFLNVTPKPDIFKISFLDQSFQLLYLRKRTNFASILHELLKVIIL